MNETRNDLGSPDATLVADRNVPQLSGVAAVADHEQAAPAAQGWKLVPVNPTPEQFHAYFTAFVARMKRYPTDPVTDPQRRDCFAEGYRAMLAAAPVPRHPRRSRDQEA